MIYERINALLLALHLPPVHPRSLKLKTYVTGNGHVSYVSLTPVHDFLDNIDRHVGIRTRFTFKGNLATVGERLRRLERHVGTQEHPPYFWLGAITENPKALTG